MELRILLITEEGIGHPNLSEKSYIYLYIYIYLFIYIQGVSKKMLVSGKMAITPLWKELLSRSNTISKTKGSELSDEHKNFMIPSKND